MKFDGFVSLVFIAFAIVGCVVTMDAVAGLTWAAVRWFWWPRLPRSVQANLARSKGRGSWEWARFESDHKVSPGNLLIHVKLVGEDEAQ